MTNISDTKNNIAQLYFILGTTELLWNFPSELSDAPNIHRFAAGHMVKTHFLVENLGISKQPLSILEKRQVAKYLAALF